MTPFVVHWLGLVESAGGGGGGGDVCTLLDPMNTAGRDNTSESGRLLIMLMSDLNGFISMNVTKEHVSTPVKSGLKGRTL